MAIIGIGLDLVKISRIRALAERWHDRFLHRLYTEEERRIRGERSAPKSPRHRLVRRGSVA